MNISTTRRAIQKQAARDLAKKLKLERGFMVALRSFFAAFRQDFKATYASGGQFNVKDYSDEMKVLLKQQYRRIAREFGKTLTVDITKNSDYELKEGEAAAVTTALVDLVNERALEQTQYIMSTNQIEIDQALASVLAESDGNLTNEQIAALVTTKLKVKQAHRVQRIAQFETNAVAEHAKEIEVETLISLETISIGGLLLHETVVKQWDSILDQVTRINHAVADGQRRRIGEPFDVGGQQLKRPGDTSLGATLDNVMECRCSTQYVLGDPTVL